MKKLFACFMMVTLTVMLSACSSSYERDTSAGEVIDITVNEMSEKINKKETFAIVFTQTTCSHCIDFKNMLSGYLLDHKVTLYDVVLDEAPQDEQQKNLETIRKTFPGLKDTPSLYYVKAGEMDAMFNMGKEGITKDKFDDWVQEHKLDEKK